MSSLFSSPNYGAAATHIKELMAEREDFLAAAKAQAARIATLEHDLAAVNEQLEVSTLVAESRRRQIEDLEAANSQKDELVLQLRTTLRLLWGWDGPRALRTRAPRSADCKTLARAGPTKPRKARRASSWCRQRRPASCSSLWSCRWRT